jgi:predicted membrane protein
MDHESRYFTTRGFIGIILISIGVLYSLDYLNIIHQNISDIVFSFPSLLIFIGIIKLINSRNKLTGFLFILIGGVLIVPKIFPFVHYNSEIVFAVILIAFGIYVIFGRRNCGNRIYGRRFEDRIRSDWGSYRHHGEHWKEFGKDFGKDFRKDFNNCNDYERATETESIPTEESDQDKIDDVAIFGGGKRILHSDNFKGGTITAIFGGSEVDLSNCKLAMGENVIDVMAIFGGMTILVPSDWKIIVNVFPLFGGFSVKGRKDPNVDYDPAKALIIKGVVIFGGGEIKIYKK